MATLDIDLNCTRSGPVAQALSDHDVPFVFSTGYGSAGVNKDFCSRPVLTKPYTGPQLIGALTALLQPALIAKAASGGLGAD